MARPKAKDWILDKNGKATSVRWSDGDITKIPFWVASALSDHGGDAARYGEELDAAMVQYVNEISQAEDGEPVQSEFANLSEYERSHQAWRDEKILDRVAERADQRSKENLKNVLSEVTQKPRAPVDPRTFDVVAELGAPNAEERSRGRANRQLKEEGEGWIKKSQGLPDSDPRKWDWKNRGESFLRGYENERKTKPYSFEKVASDSHYEDTRARLESFLEKKGLPEVKAESLIIQAQINYVNSHPNNKDEHSFFFAQDEKGHPYITTSAHGGLTAHQNSQRSDAAMRIQENKPGVDPFGTVKNPLDRLSQRQFELYRATGKVYPDASLKSLIPKQFEDLIATKGVDGWGHGGMPEEEPLEGTPPPATEKKEFSKEAFEASLTPYHAG